MPQYNYFFSHVHCTFLNKMIPQQLPFSATLNLGMSLKNYKEMAFNELDQGFFQIHELDQGDVWTNIRVILVKTTWNEGIVTSHPSNSLPSINAQLLQIVKSSLPGKFSQDKNLLKKFKANIKIMAEKLMGLSNCLYLP